MTGVQTCALPIYLYTPWDRKDHDRHEKLEGLCGWRINRVMGFGVRSFGFPPCHPTRTSELLSASMSSSLKWEYDYPPCQRTVLRIRGDLAWEDERWCGAVGQRLGSERCLHHTARLGQSILDAWPRLGKPRVLGVAAARLIHHCPRWGGPAVRTRFPSSSSPSSLLCPKSDRW